MGQDRPGKSNESSRREFLTTTAAAAIGAGALLGAAGRPAKAGTPAPTLGPIPTAKSRTPVGMDEPLRIGVIGTGGMGTGHCGALISLAEAGREKVDVVALCDVCDPRVESAKKMCEDRQGFEVDTYRHHEDLLARDDLHGVLIASPEHWHAQHAIDAIASGRDVYVEKPLTLRLEEALHFYRVAKANPDMIVQVGTQMTMLPKYQAARDLIKEGAIGKPTFSQTSYCRNSMDGEWLYYGLDPKWDPNSTIDWKRWCGWLGDMPWDPELYARWRRYRATSTGIIGDLLVHVVTPLMYALDMGWPTRVTASGGHYVDKVMENHDQVNLTVEFEGEHTMIVAGSTANEVGLETMIRGHEANLYLNSRHCVLRPERLFVDDIDERTVTCPDIGNDQDQLRLDWLRCIRTREQNKSPIDLATMCMVVVDLATRSMWEGGAFKFDPSTMQASKI